MEQRDYDRQKLISLFKEADRKLLAAEIMDRYGVPEGFRRPFRQWLKELQAKGLLSKSGQHYLLRARPKIRGRLQVSTRGFAFVDGDGGKSAFMAPGSFKGFLDGDFVEVSLVPGKRGDEGVDPHLIERGRSRLIGRLRESHKGYTLEAEDRRLTMLIPVEVPGEAPGDGSLVRVEILDFDLEQSVGFYGEHPLHCRLLEVLSGWPRQQLEILRILDEQGVDERWFEEETPVPERVEDGGVERIDLTDFPFVTIDPPDARDHDDAVFARWTDQGAELFVAIADVAGFVRPGAPLDERARSLGCSTYLPGRVLPMLPDLLSADLASLRSGVDRPVVFARMDFDFQGELEGCEWGLGTIRSRADLSYDLVQAQLDDEKDLDDPELKEQVDTLGQLARLLMGRRSKRGTLEIGSEELNWQLDDQGRPEGVTTKAQRFSEKMIEIFMVTANDCVGEKLLKANLPSPYRVHDRPDPDRLAAALSLTERLGLPPVSRDATVLELNKVLKKAKGLSCYPAVSGLLLRAMARAVYSAEATGHFGLSSTTYLHFTSPIRRYPDLLTHRAIRWALGDRPMERLPSGDVLQEECAQASRCERRSVEVERTVGRLFTCMLLADRIDDEFDCRLRAVGPKGLTVALLDPPVIVKVPMEGVGGNAWSLDPAQQVMAHRRSGKRYQLGDELKIRLIDVNISARTTTAVLVKS